MLEAIIGSIVSSAVAELARTVTVSIAGNDVSPLVTVANAPDAIRLHVQQGRSWAGDVGVQDLIRARPLRDVFVELDLNTKPLRTRGRAEPDRSFRISDLPNVPGNIVLIGDPGAGKTTSLKKLLMLISDAAPTSQSIPILLRLRRLETRSSLVSELLTTLGLFVGVREEFADYKAQVQRRMLAKFLDDIGATVLLDGFDELPRNLVPVALADLEDLIHLCCNARFIITSRSGAFDYSIPKSTVLEISPLSNEQIRAIATKWLSGRGTEEFLKQLRMAPFYGSEVRPLSLIQLCHVYDRTGRIPDRPKAIYRLICRLFVEDWDSYQRIRRESQFDEFDADLKQEFLEAVAFRLAADGHRGYFTHEHLRDAYLAIHDRFALPRNAASRVAEELEAHTGLILESGLDGYEFFHLSLQEYLAAEYIVKAGYRNLTEWPLARLANEYAVAVALSSEPSAFLGEVVKYGIVKCTPDTDVRAPQDPSIPAFVTRLTIERPSWTRHVLLGASYCLLLGYAHGRNLEVWAEWANLTAVRESLHDFIQLCTIQRVDGDLILLRLNESANLAGGAVLADFIGALSPFTRLVIPAELYSTLA